MKRSKRMEEKIYTVEEVASKLRVDARTVRKWIRNGDLAAIDVGREYRIRSTALDEFIRRREERQKPPDT
jgi:excisionase family DNA binding protein